MKKILSYKWYFILAVLFLAVPIFLSWVFTWPLTNIFSGKESGWIGFWGSYIGATIGGMVAFGVTRIQIVKQEQLKLKDSRSYITLATIILNFDKKQFANKNHRILLTDDFNQMNGNVKDITYYSLKYVIGEEAIFDVSIEVTVGNDKGFTEIATISAWLDYVEKGEEILIPLCSKDLNIIRPSIKLITVTYKTSKEKIICKQSEKEHFRNFYIDDGINKKLILNMKTKLTQWKS